MPLNTLAIIQARMSSSRLPGKVLMDIAGKPMVQHVIERTKEAKLVDHVILATTNEPSDEILVQFCQKQGIAHYQGSLADVLDRFYQAALHFHPDVIVRLTADCPLIDPQLIDLAIASFTGNYYVGQALTDTQALNFPSSDEAAFDFVANRLPPPWKRTVPIGLDVEVCSFDALQTAWLEAGEAYQREHVMPFLYEGLPITTTQPIEVTEWHLEQGITPRGFRVGVLNHHPDYGQQRWTVDTPEDLELIRLVYARLGDSQIFGWKKVLSLLEKEPELAKINAHVAHKSAYDAELRGRKS